MLKAKFDKEEYDYSSNHLETPLHYASFYGVLEVVECLIENGADVNAKEEI